MQEENLNINYHIKRLVLKALNRCENMKQAAQALGISERHVWRLKKDFNIKRGEDKKYYFADQSKQLPQRIWTGLHNTLSHSLLR